MAAIHGSFGPEWKSWAIITLHTMQKCVEIISDPAWLTGIVRDVFGNAWGLLASSGLAGALLGAWYWGEIHFPSRIIRLCNAIERDHRAATRGELLEVARQGLGRLPTNIAMSKLTFLRRMLTGWGGSKRQIAKSMAASIEYIAVEARALASVKSLADENQITALLVRGCHYEAQNNRDQAFTEYEAATKVVSDNYCITRLGGRLCAATAKIYRGESTTRTDTKNCRRFRARRPWLQEMRVTPSDTLWNGREDIVARQSVSVMPIWNKRERYWQVRVIY